MATVNKDFKIKSGLVVEGLQGTINGETILTENAGDQYILDLIGGETLIKSVDTDDFTVTAGLLTVAAGSDIARDGDITSAIDALTTADIEEGVTNQYFTTARVDSHLSGGAGIDYQAGTISVATGTGITLEQNDFLAIDRNTVDNWYDANGSAATAEQNAKDYADDLINDASNASDEVWSAYKTATEIGVAQTAAEAYTDTRETAITTAYEAYADQAEVDAKAYTDTEIAALVDSAPALLDTLNELAAAIGDNPNYATDLATSVGTKVSKAGDTMTGLLVLSADPSANLGAATKQYVDTAESDAVTSANSYTDGRETAITTAYEAYADTAEADAKTYADGLAVNYDAAGSAAQALSDAEDYADALTTSDIAEGTNEYFTDLRAKISAVDLLTSAATTNISITGSPLIGLTITAENGVADSTTDELDEGINNLYFTDTRARTAVDGTDRSFTSVELNSVAKQVAATLSAPTAGIQVAHAFAKADYRSAEYLVKVAYGTHTEISKVLLTLDSSDNIAITEYGIVGTNGSASSISAGISGANVQLQVTTANNNSTVTVMGTLLV
jgi:hypothetical protein